MEPVSPPAAGFKVISQVPGTVNDATGRPVQGVTVTAQLKGSGTTFKVTFTNAQYTPDNVKATLMAQAADVAAIDSLET
jgi:hypothetical protein